MAREIENHGKLNNIVNLFCYLPVLFFFFFSSRRRHTRFDCDWSSDVCSSDLHRLDALARDNPRAHSRPVSADETTRSAPCSSRSTCVCDGSPNNHASTALDSEIGRASCRGRVEISVVAGSLKKKKKTRPAQQR